MFATLAMKKRLDDDLTGSEHESIRKQSETSDPEFVTRAGVSKADLCCEKITASGG